MTFEEAKEILDEVLPEIRGEKKIVLPEWLRDLLRTVGDWLTRLLEDIVEFLGKILGKLLDWLGKLFRNTRFSGGGGTSPIVSIIALVLFLLLIAAIVVAVWLFVFRVCRRVKAKPKIADEDALELEELVSRPEDALALAEKNLELGDIPAAFRYLVLSLLVQMNRREVIAVRIYKTNRMYRAEMIASGKVLEEEITPIFRKFNAVRFGRRPISREEYDGFRERYDRLLQDVDARIAAEKRGKAGKS